jgi:hypothetical protein
VWFDRIVIFLILANTVFLCFSDPHARCCWDTEENNQIGGFCRDMNDSAVACTNTSANWQWHRKTTCGTDNVKCDQDGCVNGAVLKTDPNYGPLFAKEGKGAKINCCIPRTDPNNYVLQSPSVDVLNFSTPVNQFGQQVSRLMTPEDKAGGKVGGPYFGDATRGYVFGSTDNTYQCANPEQLEIVGYSEWFFNIAFTLEMIPKIIGFGFVLHKGAYLRDAWNWLDFAVVAIGWISISGAGGGLSALRTFRVLRPLRTVTNVPAMKIIGACAIRLGVGVKGFVVVLSLFTLPPCSLYHHLPSSATPPPICFHARRYVHVHLTHSLRLSPPPGSSLICPFLLPPPPPQVVSLVSSVGAMKDVAMLVLFLFLFYAIIGLQLWKGYLRSGCSTFEVFVDVGKSDYSLLRDSWTSALSNPTAGAGFVYGALTLPALYAARIANQTGVAGAIKGFQGVMLDGETQDCKPGVGCKVRVDPEYIQYNPWHNCNADYRTLTDASACAKKDPPGGACSCKCAAGATLPFMDSKGGAGNMVKCLEKSSGTSTTKGALVLMKPCPIEQCMVQVPVDQILGGVATAASAQYGYRIALQAAGAWEADDRDEWKCAGRDDDNPFEYDFRPHWPGGANTKTLDKAYSATEIEQFGKLNMFLSDDTQRYQAYPAGRRFTEYPWGLGLAPDNGGQRRCGGSRRQTFKAAYLEGRQPSPPDETYVQWRRQSLANSKNPDAATKKDTAAVTYTEINGFILAKGPYIKDKAGKWLQEMDDNFNRIEGFASVQPTVKSYCKLSKDNNPGNGFIHFDDVLGGMLAVYTSVTLEGWVDIMYGVSDAHGWEWLAVPVFITMVLLGAYFFFNLALAVMSDEYNDAKEAEAEEKLKEEHIALEKFLLEKNMNKEQYEASEEAYVAEQQRKKKDLKPPCNCSTPIHTLVTKAWFDYFIIFVILLNTLTMSFNYCAIDPLSPEQWVPGFKPACMHQWEEEALAMCNVVFTVIFVIEMILKLIGLGPLRYVKDPWNDLDGFIVIFSVIELGLSPPPQWLPEGAPSAPGSGIGALRTFRLLRVFKLLKSFEELRKIVAKVFACLIGVSYTFVLLLLIMFIFSLLGMQIFGGKFTEDRFGGETPRGHFDTLWWSFVTVFQVLTGENWNDVIVNSDVAACSKENCSPTESSGVFVSSVYFILLNCVGNYMVMNLFLAILVEQFENPDEEEDEEDEGDGPGMGNKVVPVVEGKYEVDGANGGDAAGGGAAASPALLTPDADGAAGDEAAGTVPDPEPKPIMNENSPSLFILSHTNPFRVACFTAMNHPAFDNFILVLIGVSSVFLAIDEPWLTECKYDSDCPYAAMSGMLFFADRILTVIFSLELIIKVIALGFVMHKHSYLRNGWNFLDFFIVCISILSVCLPESDPTSTADSGDSGVIKALRSLRALRALRPLRVVSRYPGLRLVVNAVFKALPACGYLGIVVLLFYLIFGIMGTQLWAGSLGRCNEEGVLFKDCSGPFRLQYKTCELLPTTALIDECYSRGSLGMMSDETVAYGYKNLTRRWESLPQNYDDVGRSMLTVFEITSGEMWPDIMYTTVDAVGPGADMKEGNAQFAAAYYMLVLFFCDFLLMNAFVGVIIEKYNQLKEEGTGVMTDDQKKWADAMMLAMHSKSKVHFEPPKNGLRNAVFRFVQNAKTASFQTFIMTCIFLNTVLLAVTWTDEPVFWTQVLEIINLIFVGIFALEMVLKLFALDVQYFKTGWNIFDGSLVVLSFVGMVGDMGQFATLLRIFRVFRILRLLKGEQFAGLRVLLTTLLTCFPAVGNVGLVLLLLHFIFSCLAMNVFSEIKSGGKAFLFGDPVGDALIHRRADFADFPRSMLSLLRISTGESYNGMMHDLMVEEPYCTGSNCGNHYAAPLFMVVFFTLSAYILLNLLVAIIIDGFGENKDMSEAKVTEEHIEAFREIWAKYDPEGTNTIAYEQLRKFVEEVPYPLGLSKAMAIEQHKEKRADGIQFNTPQEIHPDAKANSGKILLRSLNIKNFNGRVLFDDTLEAMTNAAMGIDPGAMDPSVRLVLCVCLYVCICKEFVADCVVIGLACCLRVMPACPRLTLFFTSPLPPSLSCLRLRTSPRSRSRNGRGQ